MLVDAHCHLDFSQFDADRDEVMGRAGDMVVVNSTVEPGLVGKGLALAERYDNVYCMLGVAASELDEANVRRMMVLIEENRESIVGLGEAGLDYYWVKDEDGRARERGYFSEIADLSVRLGLPLLVHSRDAESDCINILRERKVRAIMHCFSGTLEEAASAIDLGCLISVPANVVSSKSRQRLAEWVPLESMVLETDAPYLSPVRGQRNEPANVRAGCDMVARLKGLSPREVEEATAENALRFLGIRL